MPLPPVSRRRDQAVEAALQARSPEVTWDIKNQAAVHLWYEKRFGFPVLPLRSVEEGIATFPETATSVGVRLTDDGDLYFHAPLGLQDLFDLALRRNPRRVTPEVFTRRAVEKVDDSATPASAATRRWVTAPTGPSQEPLGRGHAATLGILG